MLALDQSSWIISDTHWGHHNIIRYSHRPENHDTLMIQNWRDKVKDDDTVLHLGDLVWFSSNGWPRRALSGLPGKKYLIPGNHDSHKRTDGLKFERIPGPLLVTVEVDSVPVHIAFSHYPMKPVGDWSLNIHGHIHTNQYPWYALEDDQHRYRNVCVELIDYAPVRLGDIVRGLVGGTPTSQGRFSKEADPEADRFTNQP